MSRVIQDSDDELDDELEVDTHQSEKDASPKHSTSDASSTEALRRQIEAAHRAHLQSQFSVLGGNTSEVHAQKRKLPDDFNSNSATTEDSKTTVATNGMFLGGSSNSMRAHQEPVVDAVPHLSQSANGADWLLDSTMRDAYAVHNPAMFPEPSSTIPNATLTQQRLMNGIRAPASPGSDLEIERPPFQPDASIPWSEYLKSPTDTAEHLRSSTQGAHTSQDLLDPGSEALHNDHSTRSTLHGGSQGSLLLVGGLSTQEAPQTVTDAQDATAISKREFPDNLGHVQSQRGQTSSFATEGPRSSSRQAVKKRRSPSRASASDDDLAELGVPKEQYQPRPSRSRSSRVDTQESIDYSVRPERATRTTRRRKPSPDSPYDQISLSTPDRIRQICEMGFTPSTSARALRKNNGDVTQTVNWLITNRVADDELLSHTSQMSQVEDARSGGDVDKLKTNVNSESPDAIASVGSPKAPGVSVTVLSDMEKKSPSGVQVVIPTKSPNPAMNPKQKKVTSSTVAPTEVVPEEIKVKKKRGRGRPKKVAKASHVEDIGLQQSVKQSHRVESTAPSMEKTTQLDSVQSQEDKNLENASIAKSREDLQCSESESTTAAVASTKATPEPAALPDRPEMEPITPERVKKPTPREQPSSNRAKVPYRVGLSKRARIAPLLRTVKK